MNEQKYSTMFTKSLDSNPITNPKEELNSAKDVATFYQSISEYASDGVVILDINGKYIYVSSSATRIYGYNFDDLVGVYAKDLTHPDDLLTLLPQLEELILTPNTQFVSEYRFKKKSGEWIWMESTFTNLFNNPNVEGLVVNFRIIEERKAYLERLKYVTEIQSVVIEIGHKFMNASIYDVDKQKNEALEVLGRLIDADRTYIFSYDFKNKIAVNTHEWCNEGVESQFSNLQNVPFDIMGYWPAKHAAGEAIEIEDMDLEQDEDVKKALSEQGIKSIIALPIMIQADCIGFVGIDSVNKMKIFDIHVINILKLFTQQLSDYHKKQSAELLLVTNEARYRLTQEVGAIGSWEYNIRNDKYWNSHQLRKLFGVENNTTTDFDEINKLIQSTICNPQPVNQALIDLINNGKPYEIEFEIIRKNDGEKRILYSHAELVPDVECNFTLVRGVVSDITERRKREQKLKNSEALLAATLRHSRFGIWSVDLNHNLLYFNDTFANDFFNTFGIKLEVGMKLIDKLTDQMKVLWGDRYQRTFANQSFIEEDVIDLGDHKIYIEVSSTPIIVDGEVVGASFYGEDITDRKVAEQKLIQSTQNLSKIIKVSNQFVKPKSQNVNFDEITAALSQLSGAKYVVFNRMFADYSQSVSISGLEKSRETILKYLGVDFVNNKWKREEAFESKWKSRKLTVLPDVGSIMFADFQPTIVKMVIEKFNIGNVAVVRIDGNNKIVGNLIFIYENGKTIENPELIEMFTYQLGQYIERMNAEDALNQKVNEMERFHKLTVNRELTMIELKKEINELLLKMGQEEKYRIVGG